MTARCSSDSSPLPRRFLFIRRPAPVFPLLRVAPSFVRSITRHRRMAARRNTHSQHVARNLHSTGPAVQPVAQGRRHRSSGTPPRPPPPPPVQLVLAAPACSTRPGRRCRRRRRHNNRNADERGEDDHEKRRRRKEKHRQPRPRPSRPRGRREASPVDVGLGSVAGTVEYYGCHCRRRVGSELGRSRGGLRRRCLRWWQC